MFTLRFGRRAALLAMLLTLGGCVIPLPPPAEPLEPLRPLPEDIPVAARVGEDPATTGVPGAPPPPAEHGPHQLAFTLGAGHWPEMGDLDPTSSGFSPSDFGEFDEWGFAVDVGYQGRIAEYENGSLWLGGEFGFISFDNERNFDVLVLPSGSTIDGSYSADLFFIAPTLAWKGEFSDRVHGYLRGGLGYYSLSLQESFSGYSDDIDSDSAFGGFVAVGVDIQLGHESVFLRIEDQIHFVTLEAFPDVLPAEDDIDGPIHNIQVGISIRL